MKSWPSIVRACRRGDPAAWRELVRMTLPHVEGCIRQLVSRARVRIQPSAEDLCVAVYGALRRDHGRLLTRLEDGKTWTAWMALLVRHVVQGAVGNAEAEAPTRAASDEAARSWTAYRETPLEPWDRVLVALFYFRGMRYVDIALLFDDTPAKVADVIRKAAYRILARHAAGTSAGDPPIPIRGPSCPTNAVLFDFVHREVAQESRRVLTEHTDSCAACRLQAEQYRRLLMGLASALPAGGAGDCLTDDEMMGLVERSVPREARERVGRHLAECPDCWDGYDFLRAAAEGEKPPAEAPLDTPQAERLLSLGPPIPREGTPEGRIHADHVRARRKRMVKQIVRRQVVAWGGIGLTAAFMLTAAAWAFLRGGSRAQTGTEDARPPGADARSGAPVEGKRESGEAALYQLDLDGIRGGLRVRAGGIGRGVEITKKAGVSLGDELIAYDDGAAFSVLGAILGIREGTMRIVRASPGELRIELEEGEAYVRVRPDGPGVQIRAPHGRVETMSRPGFPVTLTVQAWRTRTVLVVHEGKARLQGDEGRVDVTKGGWTSVRSGEGPMGIAYVDTPPPPAWAELRLEANPPPPFFDILSPVVGRGPGVVIAVPHASSEPGAGRVAARLGWALEVPVLFARYFEPADVNRPQETQWGPTPTQKQTPESRQIYQLFRSFLLRASGQREFPLPLYVEIHGDELTGAAPIPAVEVVTRGFEAADLERLRDAWNRNPGHPPVFTRIPFFVDLLSPVVRAGGQEFHFAFAGYPGSFAQGSDGENVRRALIVRLPRLIRLDPDMARRFGEILADVVKEAMPAAK